MSNNLRAIVAACFAFYGILSTNLAAAADVDRSVIELSLTPPRAHAQAVACPARHSRQAGAVNALLSEVDPGRASPVGPIIDLSGLKLTAGGKPLTWRRDDVDLYAFHCTVPAGADAVEAALEYLIPGDKGGYGAGRPSTARLAILNWYLVTLYPDQAGRRVARHSRSRQPDAAQRVGRHGTAVAGGVGHTTSRSSRRCRCETLADSPALCGRLQGDPARPERRPAALPRPRLRQRRRPGVSDELKGRSYERLVAEAGRSSVPATIARIASWWR